MLDDYDYVVQVVRKNPKRSDGVDAFLGTGVVFATDKGLEVLTACHVLHDSPVAAELWIQGGWFKTNPQRVLNVRTDVRNDAAVLTIDGVLSEDQMPPELASTKRNPTAAWADDMRLVGYANLIGGYDVFPTGRAVGRDGPSGNWKLAGSRAKGVQRGTCYRRPQNRNDCVGPK